MLVGILALYGAGQIGRTGPNAMLIMASTGLACTESQIECSKSLLNNAWRWAQQPAKARAVKHARRPNTDYRHAVLRVRL